MYTVYIAGPFTGNDKIHDIEANIIEASKYAAELARHGYAFICPHKNTKDFQHLDDVKTDFWYEMDIELLRRCDGILMMPRWPYSKGAIAERDYCLTHRNALGKMYDIIYADGPNFASWTTEKVHTMLVGETQTTG